MKHVAIVAVLLLCMTAIGCYSTPVMPPMGLLVSRVSAPLSADNQGVKVGGAKVGMGTVEGFVWVVSTGDCSIETAARSAGITSITYCDYEYFNVLGVYQKFTIKVHGD